MLSLLSPSTRLCLIETRVAAMRRGAAATLDALDTNRASQPACIYDAVAFALLKSELLYLDGQADSAIRVYDASIEPRLNELDPVVALRLARNRSVLAMAELQQTPQFYNRVDEMHIRGVESWDTASVLAGIGYAEEGRHYEALPRFWQQVCQTAALFDWTSQSWASRRIAREYLQVGDYLSASWHCVLGLDAKTAARVAHRLLADRQVDAVRTLVEKLLPVCRLQRHAQVICAILVDLLDLVPDDLIPAVNDWLITLASVSNGDYGRSERLRALWRAVSSLLPRIAQEARGDLVEIAVGHPIWQQAHVVRKELIEAVHHAVALGISRENLQALVGPSLKLVTCGKHDLDFEPAVNLLCEIAEADEQLREAIGKQLYPPEQRIGGSLLAQAAPLFGRPIKSERDLAALTEAATRGITAQVERLGPEDVPAQTRYITATSLIEGGKICVNIGAGLDVLQVLLKHRAFLPEANLDPLIDAVLEMLTAPDNSTTNRTALAEALGDLAEAFSLAQATRAAEGLLPFAKGDFEESKMSGRASQNFLSRFCVRDGCRGQLQGMALVSLASLERRWPGQLVPWTDDVLGAALVDLDPEVRRHAFVAARQLPTLPPRLVSWVLMGTQDGDPTTAMVAWTVFAQWSGPTLDEAHWQGVLFGLSKAMQNGDASVRRAAAQAANNLSKHVPEGPCALQLQEVRQLFQNDACYSVRAVA